MKCKHCDIDIDLEFTPEEEATLEAEMADQVVILCMECAEALDITIAE